MPELRAQQRQFGESVGLEVQELQVRIGELQAEYLRRKGGEDERPENGLSTERGRRRECGPVSPTWRGVVWPRFVS